VKSTLKSLFISILTLSAIYGQSAFALEKLRLIADYNLPTGEKFKETEIGGLSGLVFDKK